MKDSLRGAIIGYGFISSKGHVPAYLQRLDQEKDVEICAVADICDARLQLAKVALPHAKFYRDHETLLRELAADLDFVDICVPPSDHARIALLAMDYGLHVLCEKPLTTTTEEAHALLEKAIASKRVLFPCHNYRHAPVIKAIAEILDSGRIGKINSVTLNTFRNTHAKGVTEWETHWRRFHKWSGGGIAMDHGSHSFYLAFDWLRSYPTAVTAKMTNLSLARDATNGYDTEDNFSCVLSFPTGTANLQLTWTAGVRKVIYTLQGKFGAITVEDDDVEIAVMEKTNGEDVAQGNVTWKVEKKTIASHWMDASHVGWFNSLFDEFKAAIATNDYAGGQAQEALRCVQLINAAYVSAQEKCREVILDQPKVRSL